MITTILLWFQFLTNIHYIIFRHVEFFLKTIFVKESVFLVKEIEAIFFFFFFLGCGNVLGIFHFCWNGLKWCHTIIVCNWKVFRFRIGSSSFHIIITHNLKLKADGTLLMLLSKVPSLISYESQLCVVMKAKSSFLVLKPTFRVQGLKGLGLLDFGQRKRHINLV